MIIRIITAIIALCLFIPICYFSYSIVFPIACVLMACIALWEIWHCMAASNPESDKIRIIGPFWLYIPNYLIAIIAPIVGYYLMRREEMLSFASSVENVSFKVISILAFYMFLLLLYYFSIAVFSKGKINIETLATLYMMTLYIVVSFTCLVLLRYGRHGIYLYLLPFAGAWISDTFAYFTGRLFGRHKLIPEVSPKKTIEGCIGGIIFTAIGFIIFGFTLSKVFNNVEPNYILLAVSGAVVSIIAQIGDLIASVIKRYYGIKDYGKLFPGHGGVLDRFDSVLSTAPIVYILSVIFSNTLL